MRTVRGKAIPVQAWTGH